MKQKLSGRDYTYVASTDSYTHLTLPTILRE